ncbi:acyl-[acyl-carrier-protein] thioesterase [Limosilactobacillus caccae]|uniref:acyl-[acyl-carrier-protein] thioesterase n=1 Tax=Limosilactobacillus caccae TaxID=1926284 RepID=UPI000970772B|nr:acyl-ACP thioesterase domain-containing protein [Limosilactobacillus caccae]
MDLKQGAQTYEMPHLLTYYECDETGHPSMSMLLSMISMASDEHSMSLGMDTKLVQQTGGTWVVSGYEGELTKEQPTFGDTVILGTRAVAYNRFFAVREFWLTDQEHHIVYAKIKAIFVFMNLTTRRMESIPPELITPYQSPAVKRISRLKRPAKLSADDEVLQKDYQVRYFDLDANHHVNNARYFDWLLDPLGRDFLRHHRLRKFSLQYLREVRDGETVASRVNQPQLVDDQLLTRHEIKVADGVNAVAGIEWDNC